MDELDELTIVDKAVLGPTRVIYLVLPLRGTRGDLKEWIRQTKALCGELEKLVDYEGPRWPFGKVMRMVQYIAREYQRRIKIYYEVHAGVTWRMGRTPNSQRGKLIEGDGGDAVIYPENFSNKPTR